MISQTTEYALRAVVYLAQHDQELQTATRIAEGTKVSSAYLSKILNSLGSAHLVHAQRGKNGGFTLARPASEMTMLDVVNAVEPVHRIHTCPLALAAHGTNLCALHRRLDDSAAYLESAFGDVTIASLLASTRMNRPLCSFPNEKASAIKTPAKPPAKSIAKPVTSAAVKARRSSSRSGSAPRS